MNPEQALLRLGSSTSEAVQAVLRTFSPDGVTAASVSVVPSDADPFANLHVPAVAAEVSYVDGVTGGNVMVIPLEGARRLAAAMMGTDPEAVEPGGELDELGFSAVGEAMNQMMAAAARATSEVLDEEVEIAPPEVKQIEAAADAAPSEEQTGSVSLITFSFCGSPCALVQYVPHAFIVRMTRALDELTAEHDDQPLSESLRHVDVRVWAELGRARMPAARVVALPGGAVVDLDREAESPIDLYADGLRFATGRLLVTEDGGLAVRIEEVIGAQTPDTNPNPPMEVIA